MLNQIWAVLVLVLFFSSVGAAATEYKVLLASEVKFWVRNFGITTVSGQFKDFSGRFQIADPFESSTASAEVKTASIDTENHERDEHLKSADFLDVTTHPTLSFESTSVKGSRESFELHGDLTIKKKSNPIVLKCQEVKGESPAQFKCEGNFDRRQYGITSGVTIGDRVNLELKISGSL